VKLGLIVEGHGEVQAAPVLLRRLASELDETLHLEIPPPLRVPRSKLLKEEELRRAVELMARKTSPDGALLVLLDADSDCPAEVGPRLLEWARAVRADRPVAVVLAKSEYEAWLIAAAVSLRGKRGLPADLDPPNNPEAMRDAKGWLGSRMPHRYSETIDQAALTALMSLVEARACMSFQKLERDVRRLVTSAREAPTPPRA
jgi:hypothetical protein